MAAAYFKLLNENVFHFGRFINIILGTNMGNRHETFVVRYAFKGQKTEIRYKMI